MGVHFKATGAWGVAAFIFFVGILPLHALAGDTPTVSPGTHRYKVVGNLYVDIAGDYPADYGPKWQSDTLASIPVQTTNYMADGKPHADTRDATLADINGSGRAWFRYRYSLRSTTCYADITGADTPILIGAQPRTFTLSNFHLLTPSGNGSNDCQQGGGKVTARTTGTLTLSADADGNIGLSFVLDEYDNRDRRTFQRVSDTYAFRNIMTPQMAAADLNQKNQASAAAAAQAQADADQQKADATDVAATKASALKGEAVAQWLLGEYYRLGDKGVTQNDAESFKWYQMAADQETIKYSYNNIPDIVADAQYWIANYYQNGTGVPKSLKNSVIWYKKCANKNVPLCQIHYAEAYADGSGVIPDYVEALTWCLIALANPKADSDDPSLGDEQRSINADLRKHASNLKEELEFKMNGAQIAEAQGRARAWWAAH